MVRPLDNLLVIYRTVKLIHLRAIITSISSAASRVKTNLFLFNGCNLVIVFHSYFSACVRAPFVLLYKVEVQ